MLLLAQKTSLLFIRLEWDQCGFYFCPQGPETPKMGNTSLLVLTCGNDYNAGGHPWVLLLLYLLRRPACFLLVSSLFLHGRASCFITSLYDARSLFLYIIGHVTMLFTLMPSFILHHHLDLHNYDVTTR